MIRLLVGFFLVFGAVGNLDYAMETGTPEPHWTVTTFLVGLGFTLMYYGMKRIKEVYGED